MAGAGRVPGSSPTLPRLPGSAARAAPVGAPSATVAIYSVKGGVGKTTLAANLAWIAAVEHAQRTLLWDLDAAGGAGFLLGAPPPARAAASAIFSRQVDPAELVRATAWPGLDLLPADESLRALDSQLLRLGKRRRLARLTEALAGTYARIVLDCPPVMSEIGAQVIRAADVVIVPLPPSPLSARALEMVVRDVGDHARRPPAILPVCSMLDLRRTLHRQAREAHPDWPVIPYASAVEACAVRRMPLGAFEARNPVMARLRFLWTAIERKLAERHGEAAG